jgi:hypothetical protein
VIDHIDKLARGLFAAHLELAEGFTEETAERISRRECPEHYYDLAEDLSAEFPAFGPETPGGAL